MHVVNRQNEAQFVAQAYREQLPRLSKRIFLRELQYLAEQHGEYACVVQRDSQSMEVAFSAQAGYLLGECVWDYFGRPDNLIYCEAIGSRANCVLVVVRDGQVYLDRTLLSCDVEKELRPALVASQAYLVYTYGDVPIRHDGTFEGATFSLPKASVGEFNHLKEPLFDQLVPVAAFALVPLSQLMRSHYLRRQDWLLASIILLVFATAMGWWYASMHRSHLTHTHHLVLRKSDSLPQAPAPTAVVTEFVQHLDALYLMPGWKIAQLDYDQGQYTAILNAEGGSLWTVSEWAKQHYYQLQTTEKSARLTTRSALNTLTLSSAQRPITETTQQVTQRLSQVLTADAIQIRRAPDENNLKKSMVTLKIRGLSPDLLTLIGEEFENLPLTLSSMTLTVKAGLVNGEIRLAIWGR